MKRRILLTILCILICISTLTGCSNKYYFEEAFFPIDMTEGAENNADIPSGEASQKYVTLVNDYLYSLTSFVNEKFNMNISKPLPEVKSYFPEQNLAASYFGGIVYINESNVSDDDSTYTIIHELLHYLSDNEGNAGFVHTVKYQDFEKHFLGYGLTEGLTDVIAIMYCQENDITLPDYVESSLDAYSNNRSIAKAYYMLEPKIAKWFFIGDYVSLANFVQSNIETVAHIPNQYVNDFDFHFHSYQDALLNCSTGSINDEYTFEKTFKASFEILAITVRACQDEELKQSIYDDVLSKHDADNVIKDMIFN